MRRIMYTVIIALIFSPFSAFASETCDDGHAAMERANYPLAAVILANCLDDLDMDVEELALVYTELARAYKRSGLYAMAVPHYEAALELTPDDSMAHVRVANMRFYFGEIEDALQLFERAIELDPNNAVAFNDRAIMLGQIGYLDYAMQDYDRAIELDPDFAVYWSNRGSAYISLNDYEQAERDLDIAYRLDPDYDHGHYNRGKLSLLRSDYYQAIEAFSQCTELCSGGTCCVLLRAEAYARSGQGDAALADINFAASVMPNYAEVFRVRGLVHLARAEFDAAREDFRQLMTAHEAGCCYAGKVAADLMFLAGLPDDALPYAQFAVESEPDDASDRLILAHVLGALSLHTEAMAAYATAFELGGAANIQIMQSNLALLGYDPGPVDGILRPQLTEALDACVRDSCIMRFSEAIHVADTSGGDPVANENEDCLQGQDYVNVRRYEAAVESFTLCIENGGLDGKPLGYAYYLRGNARLASLAFEHALADFDQAVVLAPDEELVLMGRAATYSFLGDNDAAIADVNAAIAIAPDNAVAHFDRALYLLAQGRNREALEDLDRTLILDPSWHDVRFTRAIAWMRLGQLSEAGIELDTLIANNPSDFQAHWVRAWVSFLSREDLSDALITVDQLINQHGLVDWNLIDVRGHLLAALGREDEAVASFETAINLAGPALADAYRMQLVGLGYLPAQDETVLQATLDEALRECVADACNLWAGGRF